jgi:hypothetical protein
MDRRRGRTGEPPEVKPVDVDGVRTVAIITVLWALAFVVLAFFRSELDDAGRGWWIWACLAGVGLGLLGLEYCRKRRDAIARAELDAEADAGFDDAGDWADGELAALAVEDDVSDVGFEQPTQAYSPYDETPPAAPLPFEQPTPTPPAAQQPPEPPADHSTGEHARTYSPGSRPPPGYVTGDFPAVTGDFPPVTAEFPPERGDVPPARPESPPSSGNMPGTPARHVPPPHPSRPAPPPNSPPREPAYGDMATPAGYSPDPDRSRRHPRDEELARRYREEQARAAAAGYEPLSYPEFLQDEAARHDAPASPPAMPEPPPRPADHGPPQPRRAAGFDSEFFTDEPVTETGHGADFLLDDDDERGEEYRGRRARRD